MATVFISDIHLSPTRPDITDFFFYFLKNHTDNLDALYVLGDFFETWLGDDDQNAFNVSVIQALKDTVDNRCPIYFMHGNRDFLIGKRFFKQSGCRRLRDPSIIDLYGTPTILLHGDTLCTDDISYQKYRRVVRNPFFRFGFLLLPLRTRERLAEKVRKASHQHTSSVDLKMIDATMTAIREECDRRGVKQMIHGHTHQPAIQYFMDDPTHPLNDNPMTRIVLSDWHSYGNALIVEQNGEYRLVNYDFAHTD